ncbi:P-loop containing nucleoside triphosphate hydrolase protein [Colletotrichum navitas]|uniref:P-loop containing nucleoside triphosphate hydrolase protein n=1 Tax=Colletotrichum navitas TaxID=681940 RepID=A0AAD8Q3U2_9PEZI|nr:P-loop containing nucleoside triphosphate hydrolase protein [Colletotrichum navitas]KAK1595328.1 P-loop containing nucleoside triphosphate hydrolase protein [Colletotrichum navitas]
MAFAVTSQTLCDSPERTPMPIGYYDQSPFRYNNAVKANIIDQSEFGPERYSQVVDSTMLSKCFDRLPKGDRTKIGSNGLTLSGGQRPRIALARALYLEADLLILDDILSGLDATTEDYVFRRVFGNDGIIRQRGVTAVLCTHSVRHLPMADHIIALGDECGVVEQASVAPWVIVAFFFWCCAYGFAFNFPIVWLKYWSEDAVASNPKHSGSFYLGIEVSDCFPGFDVVNVNRGTDETSQDQSAESTK